MDAWQGLRSSNTLTVHIGSWTNWSHGPIFGATLTLTQRNGNFVIAFLAVFLAFVATQLWSIVSLICHQSYSSSKSEDAFYHQRQVILRNSGSAAGVLWRLVQLASSRFKWSSRQASWTYIKRVLISLTLAALCVIGFAAATCFLATIASAVGDEVLLARGACGAPDFDAIVQNWTVYNNYQLPWFAKRVNDASNYAQQCYTNSPGRLDCAATGDLVVGPQEEILKEYLDLPSDESFCNNQKIRSPAHMSLSLLGLYFLFLTGGLIIAVSFALEPILGCLRRRHRHSRYAYYEWVTNETLQLHRLAQEAAGWGTWTTGACGIPFTLRDGDVLARLALTDEQHPRLEMRDNDIPRRFRPTCRGTDLTLVDEPKMQIEVSAGRIV
ncbi:hypothetical protein GGR57DRAFT_501634 [Xylariaceae sp. FL1272]|nr:hypothetical protein GGR57DRAFT_501634 [Xylariaceae sp. FL1272]